MFLALVNINVTTFRACSAKHHLDLEMTPVTGVRSPLHRGIYRAIGADHHDKSLTEPNESKVFVQIAMP